MNKNKLQLNYKPVQLILPVNYEHVINDCDPVVSFKEVVGGLNLRKFIKTSLKGRHDYDPEVMLHLILFGFMENIRSLRKLEQACRNDIRFMYLGNCIKPSFMAFQRFIDDKLTESIDDIFYTINQFLIEKENINTNVLHVDGTKIEANANKFTFVWRKAVLNYQSKLFIKITKALKDIESDYNYYYPAQESYLADDLSNLCTFLDIEVDRQGVEFVYGKGQRKTPLQRYYETFHVYRDKLKEYEKHLEICGSRNSYSKTDHDTTFMHGKEDYYNKTGIFKPYYNIQIGVSDEYILHYGVYPNPGDTKTWIPFFDSFYYRYGFYPDKPVADAGYGSYDNYMYNLENNMKLTMKYTMFSKEDEKKFKKQKYNIKNMTIKQDRIISEDGHVYVYSHDYENRKGVYTRIIQVYTHSDWKEAYKDLKIPNTISRDISLLEMQSAAKEYLKSDEGIKLRVRRSIEVEGAFGDIKSNSEYTRIQRRGKLGVQTEIALVLIGYNLRKYHAKKHRVLH
ncbi:MAG: transposase [Erysipelothrix sp.]|nr:transposase [Erysipelothrix sp.]